MAGRIRVWRVEKAIFAATVKTGEGARVAGGRWNSPGLPAVYCSQSLALAVVEILVHAATAEERADPRVWFELSLAASVVRIISPKQLPAGWDSPLLHPATAAIGDAWLSGRESVALRVPSAVIPGEWNYILNPRHPRFRRAIKWSSPRGFAIDRRLVEV
jgi:RES domain-containing protein